MVLTAVADADYCFISLDVDVFCSSSESNMFKNSKFWKLLECYKLIIPDPSVLPIDAEGLSMSFVLVGDEAQYIKIVSVIPNNINKEINVNFFRFLFSWKLTPVRDDCLINLLPVQQFLLQIPTTVFFQIFLYKVGHLSTSHINFCTSSTIAIAVWRKTEGLCTLLLLASNCLVTSVHAHI